MRGLKFSSFKVQGQENTLFGSTRTAKYHVWRQENTLFEFYEAFWDNKIPCLK